MIRCLQVPAILVMSILLTTCISQDLDNNESLRLIKEYHDKHEEPTNFDLTVDRLDLVYDFIIVGAGSGGSLLAHRLSENKNAKILLIEAGGVPDYLTRIPILNKWLLNSKYDWKYRTEKQKYACYSTNNVCEMPRGKALGGSSVINGINYVRGNPKDYDNWAKLGNNGWSYSEVLPYFKKTENMHIPHLMNSKFHGTNGLLSVNESSFETPLQSAFLDAADELNLTLTDYNSDHQTGFSKIQINTEHGKRHSAFQAFLEKSSNNLRISTDSLVTRVLINPLLRRANGVEVVKNGKNYLVFARKEVILSAGVVESPKLLMLSGVGPKKHLREFGIRCLKDLDVGRNLKDHVAIALKFKGVENFSIKEDVLQNEKNVEDYFQSGTGPFTVNGGLLGIGFVQTSFEKVKDYPDGEILIGGYDFDFDRKSNNDDSGNELKENESTFSMGGILHHPKSTGEITLRSRSALDHPRIDPKYLQNRQDMLTLIELARIVMKISQTEQFVKKINATLIHPQAKKCQNLKFDSEQYWECVIKENAKTFYHPVGTCKMGPKWDHTAVVDPKLKVYGIKNLRVVDASVMPTTISGHTNAVVYMIAEKAADFIKEEWKL